MIRRVGSLEDIYVQKEIILLQKVPDKGYFSDFKINENLILGLRYYRGEHQVIAWDREGSYLGQAGQAGKAPGEYISVGGFDFTGPDSFIIYDRVRDFINSYRVEKGGVVFVDQAAPGLAEQTYMDTLFRVDSALYLLSCSGPEGMHTLFRLDEKMQIAYRFHKRRHSSLIANPTYAVSKNEIYVLGAFDDRLKMLEPFIYVYSLQGKLLRKIRTKYRDIFDVNFDRSGKFMLLTSMKNIFDLSKSDEYRILDRDGHEIHTFTSLPPLDPVTILGISRTCLDYENVMYLTRPDEAGRAKLYIYDIDAGLEPEGGDDGE
ncbi:hypothetical protein JXR74_00450 [Candidatus Mcinerneyibacteriota bacterium]|nr:hypothetical protein [Candidatus Mcinerneyibacteriota bacterium]